MAKKIKCKFCNRYLKDADAYAAHLENSHPDLIPNDMNGWQFYYYMKIGKTHGKCIICGKDTKWNERTHKYHRFCDNPECKEKYKKEFQKRMMGKYGKTTLLNDPEQQKIMLSRRKISNVYNWSNYRGELHYTGTYELSFLEFLDHVLNFDPSDVMAPSPHTYYYVYDNKRHFYIPDFFIPSLNLEIEIKDGGDNANKHPKIQAVDKVKESLKDEVMRTNGVFHYLKIVNKDNAKFFQFLDKLNENFENNRNEIIFMP